MTLVLPLLIVSVPCPFITAPANGTLEINLHTRFVCDHGHALVGDDGALCSKDTCTWSSTTPVCTTGK